MYQNASNCKILLNKPNKRHWSTHYSSTKIFHMHQHASTCITFYQVSQVVPKRHVVPRNGIFRYAKRNTWSRPICNRNLLGGRGRVESLESDQQIWIEILNLLPLATSWTRMAKFDQICHLPSYFGWNIFTKPIRKHPTESQCFPTSKTSLTGAVCERRNLLLEFTSVTLQSPLGRMLVDIPKCKKEIACELWMAQTQFETSMRTCDKFRSNK